MVNTSNEGSGSGSGSVETLRQLVDNNSYGDDWDLTKSTLREALSAAVLVFQSRGLPRTRQSAPSPSDNSIQNPASSAAVAADATSPVAPTSNSPLSPTTTTSNAVADDQPAREPQAGSSGSSSSSSSSSPPIGPRQPPEDLPSTPGGLVIPPFPPLRRKRSGSTMSEGSRASHVLVSRPNGMGHGAPPIRIATGNVFEDEYDEDVIIGGKKLSGWMDEDEGKKEAERLASALDEYDEPPFTIQRLAELLVNPTANHGSLGKFLRAVEKTLLVQTPWQPQTYVPAPESTITDHSRTSYDPSLPPVMSTPKFSPIPWLHPSSDGLNGDTIEARMPGEASVSPLLLSSAGGDETSTIDEYKLQDEGVDLAAASARSPTPEPEDVDMASTTTATAGEGEEQLEPSIAHSADPGNQPYLGRVDELDTGPIQAGPQPTNGEGNGNGHGRGGREDEQMVPGAGEGGAMTPHGMSEKPVPISSTTVISEEERRIAGLRQSSVPGQGGAAGSEGEGKASSKSPPSL